MSEIKQQKKPAPHWTELMSFDDTITNVQPYFCQSTKLWIVRSLKGYGELVLRKEFKEREDALQCFEEFKKGSYE